MSDTTLEINTLSERLLSLGIQQRKHLWTWDVSTYVYLSVRPLADGTYYIFYGYHDKQQDIEPAIMSRYCNKSKLVETALQVVKLAKEH